MRSFTSSFRPLPRGWFSLVLGAILAAIWLGGYELMWRSRGFVPTLTNNEALWCAARARVEPTSVAIVGSSRLQRGLDPALFASALGGRSVVQLALEGGSPLPMLAELARDAAFRGVVVLEYMPKRWFLVDSPGMTRAQPFIDACTNPSLVADTENRLSRKLQERFVFMSPELQFVPLLSYAANKRSLPRDSRDILREDRLLIGHPREGEALFEATPWEPTLTESELDARFAEMKSWVDAIRARGGCVVVYRPPVTGKSLEEEESHYAAGEWFARATDALGTPSIDFASVPDLRSLELFDGSHPKGDDVPMITAAVARELQRLLATNVCH